MSPHGSRTDPAARTGSSWRGSLRLRLTAVFGLLFFVAAAAVLAGAVILVRNSMQYSLDIVFSPDHASDSDAGTKSIIMDSMRRNLLTKGGLNVALFVPLGVAIAQVRPRTRASLTAVAAAALPFGIEAVQYAVPWLLRAGDAQDVAGNLLGLALGMTALALPCPRTRDGRSGEPQRPRRERTAR
ncbi:VanZ family protein [Streptomyces sp. 5-8]|uniref:VanZ family protein n=1 Tax=Streptomyces musisoli TaxID=2802280 RepID=A0ABS1P2L0_9ACTN|nr:VanZ family protein [Streptomyces musisoli]MBL1106613.1 VanZ family protein [Streptomyces musisoli]